MWGSVWVTGISIGTIGEAIERKRWRLCIDGADALIEKVTAVTWVTMVGRIVIPPAIVAQVTIQSNKERPPFYGSAASVLIPRSTQEPSLLRSRGCPAPHP